jgi:uncharacterized protein (DUF3820 family)
MTTNVYFIRCGEFVKIGRGGSPHRRLRTFQCGNPYELELMGCFEATELEEARLHSAFDIYHHRAEWYFLSDSVKAFIEKHCSMPTDKSKQVVDFLTTNLVGEQGRRVAIRDIYMRYLAWCQQRHLPSGTLDAFLEKMDMICKKIDVGIEIEDNNVYCVGVQLAA